MPVRRRRHRGARRGLRAHRVQLARLPAGRRPGPALRLPRARSVRPARRSPLQRQQAADRPVREVDRGQGALEPRERAPVHPRSGDRRQRRPPARRRGLGGRDPQERRGRQPLRLGGRPAPGHAVRQDGDLRDPRQGLHDAPPGRARGPARHVRGPRLRGGDRALPVARRDRGRAAADPPHRRRVVPRRPRAHELLGLLHDRLPRAALRLRRDRHPRPGGARVQGHGEGPARGRDRGDPRRRLQPHRRGQPPRPDALVQGRRQQVLLPADAGRPALLHGLHGHRQLPQPRAPERAAADHGLAALLRRRMPRRRLPLRPRRARWRASSTTSTASRASSTSSTRTRSSPR